MFISWWCPSFPSSIGYGRALNLLFVSLVQVKAKEFQELCSNFTRAYQLKYIGLASKQQLLCTYCSYPESLQYLLQTVNRFIVPLKLCYIQNVSTSDLHHCCSESVEFLQTSCWYNPQHLLMDQINATVHTVWHIDFTTWKGQFERVMNFGKKLDSIWATWVSLLWFRIKIWWLTGLVFFKWHYKENIYFHFTRSHKLTWCTPSQHTHKEERNRSKPLESFAAPQQQTQDLPW